MANDDPFFIGKLAERTGVSRDTIRYYEATGVLPNPERSGSGYRLYGRDDVERLDFVGQAKSLGLTLNEIAEVLEIVDEGRQPCGHVRDTLRARLQDTRRRIRELGVLEARLETALIRAEQSDDRGRLACRCRIIGRARPPTVGGGDS
ncbi:MAG: heavy metal-responsive transcriptional regulator [Gemmatimonadetes bacterium]|nr:heavy metal-responsive transcriptional regulator [Gemmatimonadota bacterium]